MPAGAPPPDEQPAIARNDSITDAQSFRSARIITSVVAGIGSTRGALRDSFGSPRKVVRGALAELKRTSTSAGAKELIVEALALLVPEKLPTMVRDSARPRRSRGRAATALGSWATGPESTHSRAVQRDWASGGKLEHRVPEPTTGALRATDFHWSMAALASCRAATRSRTEARVRRASGRTRLRASRPVETRSKSSPRSANASPRMAPSARPRFRSVARRRDRQRLPPRRRFAA